MDDDDFLRIQRELRARLFEGSAAIRWRPARELAAQLLLYLDDAQACWRLTAEWLRDTLDADRVDGGYGGFLGRNGEGRSYVVMAEARRNSMALPSVLGIRFDAADASIRNVWGDPGVSAIADISQARSFSADMRGALQALGTSAKLAMPLRDGSRPVGLLCADWHRRAPSWDAQMCEQMSILARHVLGPLFAASERIMRERADDVDDRSSREAWGLVLPQAPPQALASPVDDLSLLTPAELKVARLVARGLSYKEVARQLDRSLSTVDHQLRSIREKLGARSTARLVRLLAEHAEELRGA
ncbi:MAG: LuxR C-terminal-related transcriptional regulator [Burkholderiales bacterium]